MKKYWVETYVENKDGTSYKACFECNNYYFANERLGKYIVMEDCNNADTKNSTKQENMKELKNIFRKITLRQLCLKTALIT